MFKKLFLATVVTAATALSFFSTASTADAQWRSRGGWYGNRWNGYGNNYYGRSYSPYWNRGYYRNYYGGYPYYGSRYYGGSGFYYNRPGFGFYIR